MSSFRLSRGLIAFAFYLSTLASGFGQEPFQVKFRILANTMIVVPVTIDGAGPFDFLLDTGSTLSIIDRKLAGDLHLPAVGKVILTTAQGEKISPIVHSESLLLAGAKVRSLNFSVVDHYPDLLTNVRGTLGEDFLRYFDLLIDNRRHLIQFEFGPGPFADRVTGDHLPLRLNGFDKEQKLPLRRLIVTGRVFGNQEINLQLDSGTPRIVLYPKSHKMDFLSISKDPPPDSIAGILGGSLDVYTPQTALQLGNKLFANLTVLVPRGPIPLMMDVDGLLPTSLFRSIFISHSGKFAILDPLVKTTLAQEKSAARPDSEISAVRSSQAESPASGTILPTLPPRQRIAPLSVHGLSSLRDVVSASTP